MRELDDGGTTAYTKGTESMACPLCSTAAVMETDQQPHLSPNQLPTNMQDGHRTQLFHKGPLLARLSMGLAPSGFQGGVLYKKILLIFHKLSRYLVMTAEGKWVISQSCSPQLCSSNSPSSPCIIRRKDNLGKAQENMADCFLCHYDGILYCTQSF